APRFSPAKLHNTGSPFHSGRNDEYETICRRGRWKSIAARRVTITGLRWWISGLLFLATLISYIDRLTLSVLAPLISKDLGLSNLEYASIGTWFLLTYSLGQTFFGKLQDRIGTRRGLALAMCVWSVAEIAHASARRIASLSLVRAALG